jgi:hypothetical protein
MPNFLLRPLLATAALSLAGGAHAVVVNIDAQVYGYQFPTDPAPVVGQTVVPISNAPGGALNQLTLAAGTYTVSNATGMAGADPNFSGWRFNGGDNWVWSFVIVDDATKQVVLYADAGGVQGSQAAIAAQADVQSFSTTLTLAQTTTLDFMVRDYGLYDNAGGMALNIPTAVPEPASWALMLTGALGLLGWRRRAQRR